MDPDGGGTDDSRPLRKKDPSGVDPSTYLVRVPLHCHFLLAFITPPP